VDPKVCREHLERLVTEETAALKRLQMLLDTEHEYLVVNDLEELDRAGDARQVCIGELLRIEDERKSLCRMMNLPTDPTGIDRLLNWCDRSNALKRRWAECTALATECRNRNDRNGALVSARLKRVEGLLNVLTGRANQPKVYGKQGGYESSGRSAHVLATV
jgi:flagellar biosynthesis/type III secretory pathway chaperone